METNVVMVKIWDMPVGYLSWDMKRGLSVFEYDPEFVTKNLDIAPFTMSINAERTKKQLPWLGDKNPLYLGLPPMIADSLPDKWGHSLFNAWLKKEGISTKNVSPIDHLSFIGSRAMGALLYEPANQLGDNSAFEVNVQQLYTFAKQVLNDREDTVLDSENSVLWQDLIKISSSPGGKRPKAIVAINHTNGQVISGQGNIPTDFEHYILKYDDNSIYPFARLEFVYYQMALEAGISMMPSELRTYGDVSHFLTRRFDRIDNDRIHTQTLAAMMPSADSYEDLFAVIRRLNLAYEASRQQFLRMVYNVMARNVDDHSKNIGFCMSSEGVWHLSPAYDLTYSVDLTAPAYMNRHSLTVNGKNHGITREDLISVAKQNDIQDYNALIEQVSSAVNQFDHFAKEVDIDNKIIQQIKEDIRLA
jgi:serine/threonine-protein kinase HipA